MAGTLAAKRKEPKSSEEALKFLLSPDVNKKAAQLRETKKLLGEKWSQELSDDAIENISDETKGKKSEIIKVKGLLDFLGKNEPRVAMALASLKSKLPISTFLQKPEEFQKLLENCRGNSGKLLYAFTDEYFQKKFLETPGKIIEISKSSPEEAVTVFYSLADRGRKDMLSPDFENCLKGKISPEKLISNSISKLEEANKGMWFPGRIDPKREGKMRRKFKEMFESKFRNRKLKKDSQFIAHFIEYYVKSEEPPYSVRSLEFSINSVLGSLERMDENGVDLDGLLNAFGEKELALKLFEEPTSVVSIATDYGSSNFPWWVLLEPNSEKIRAAFSELEDSGIGIYDLFDSIKNKNSPASRIFLGSIDDFVSVEKRTLGRFSFVLSMMDARGDNELIEIIGENMGRVNSLMDEAEKRGIMPSMAILDIEKIVDFCAREKETPSNYLSSAGDWSPESFEKYVRGEDIIPEEKRKLARK